MQGGDAPWLLERMQERMLALYSLDRSVLPMIWPGQAALSRLSWTGPNANPSKLSISWTGTWYFVKTCGVRGLGMGLQCGVRLAARAAYGGAREHAPLGRAIQHLGLDDAYLVGLLLPGTGTPQPARDEPGVRGGDADAQGAGAGTAGLAFFPMIILLQLLSLLVSSIADEVLHAFFMLNEAKTFLFAAGPSGGARHRQHESRKPRGDAQVKKLPQ